MYLTIDLDDLTNYYEGVYIMRIRYVKTNGEGLIKQVKGLLYYRNVHFLTSDVRKSEEKMNALVTEFIREYEKREHHLQVVEDAKKAIKNSPSALLNTSEDTTETLGFFKWLKTFHFHRLYPKQDNLWEPVAKVLKTSKSVKASVIDAKPSVTVVATQSLVPRTMNSNRNNKNNRNNQHN